MGNVIGLKRRLFPDPVCIHTVRGTVTVRDVQPGPKVATHNLIVGGWHSYFVGDDHILYHDNGQHSDEACAVPGLR